MHKQKAIITTTTTTTKKATKEQFLPVISLESLFHFFFLFEADELCVLKSANAALLPKINK